MCIQDGTMKSAVCLLVRTTPYFIIVWHSLELEKLFDNVQFNLILVRTCVFQCECTLNWLDFTQGKPAFVCHPMYNIHLGVNCLPKVNVCSNPNPEAGWWVGNKIKRVSKSPLALFLFKISANKPLQRAILFCPCEIL